MDTTLTSAINTLLETDTLAEFRVALGLGSFALLDGSTAATLNNNVHYQAKNSGGDAQSVAFIDTFNVLHLGAGIANLRISEDGNLVVGPLAGNATERLEVSGHILADLLKSRGYTAALLNINFPPDDHPYARAFVTDSNATHAAGLGNTVAGSGAHTVPVYSNGTNWIIG